MKKVAYITPELEVVNLKLSDALLVISYSGDQPPVGDEPGDGDDQI